ncbi:hypothetical protein E6P09_01055 [Haloferax mediterranei ATCC 33500]|uniref:Uncharacterized protein n=1 Tax=Haloferax mediterranei (strain ATCC 33500 / DSM 1411 / JCM 8866 / NBRC 14739 / NCIMB 2177 / R-4) TaxID=523841 RepID=I3R6F8_HALMT|nr:hypothetical protein [Haloferax mediterranei]AFK19818.1 hypothetical protein HFX_2127 [Haloferax mediterranei ATCC 33500]AHZ23201.1 hypothetical protein BM92_11385 [Haloferax mediterranei ATCC 33500]ELZ99780.1 hypothetical protein C439_12429 [Haloferax mediterranei ATCC 33500]MDX5987435.1 hypothetical protein [Haloferax mediterranei ATCC 33500]QCQ73937.1 hypothetical protein E6P09_01055 [Haloferax mediterranei ATCC 33500]
MVNIENINETGTQTPVETPRSGPLGLWDRLVGPSASVTEQALVLAFGVVFTGVVFFYARTKALDWTVIQQLLVAFLALDIAGGIVANTTTSGVEWWHRPSQRRRDHFAFVALHIYPFALALVFETVSWAEGALVYGYLLGSAVMILLSPRHLRRPVAMLFTAVGILLALVGVSFGPGLEWFVPFLYLKLLGGHLAAE